MVNHLDSRTNSELHNKIKMTNEQDTGATDMELQFKGTRFGC